VRGLPVPARNALLADVVPADAYGRAYGFERAMDTSARSSATLLGIALVAVAGVRSAILLSVIPGLLAVAAIVYAIRAAKLPKVAARQPIHFHVRPVLRAELARLVGAIAAFEFANAAATMLILRAIELLTPGHAPTPPLRSRLLSTPPTTWPRRDQHSRRPFRRPPGTGARAHDGERRVRSRVPDI
ncbi:MAG TPA: hypothetical protein VF526_07440, partial [Solirubrobacteraceae bacterium]